MVQGQEIALPLTWIKPNWTDSGLIAKIGVLQGQVDRGVLEHGNNLLQVIPVLAADANLVALHAGLNLEPGVFDQLYDLLGDILRDALLYPRGLACLVDGGFQLAFLERSQIDTPLGKLEVQNVLYLIELKFVVRLDGELVLGLNDPGAGALEVIAVADFAVGTSEAAG